MKLTAKLLKKLIQEELETIQEDGHEDVSSARRKLKTTIEDASEILQSLESTPEQELPSWWMSKITIVGEYINKARDYLLVSGDSMTESYGDMFDPYNPEGHPEPDDLKKDSKLVKAGRYYWRANNLSKLLGTSFDDYIKSFDNDELERFVNRMGDQASGRISKMKESLEDELDQKFKVPKNPDDKKKSLSDEKQEIISTMRERMEEMYADWILEEDKVERVIDELHFNDEVDGRKMVGALRDYLNKISGEMGFSDLGTKVFG